jgi:hypothetical protein
MNLRTGFPLCLIVLCVLGILLGGCLDSVSNGVPDTDSSDSAAPITPDRTVPPVMITPNASNAGIDTRTYPPHPPTIFIFSLPEAIDILGEPVFIPMDLPDGFAYGGGSANTEGIVLLSISNGSTSIQFFQVSPPRSIQGTLAGPSNPVDVNGTEGLCTVEADKHQFS